MTYAIMGAGKIGTAIAKAFARRGIEVSLASRRSPEDLTAVTEAIGPTFTPTSMQDAAKADVVLLAVPFRHYKDVAASAESWQGKIVVDAMNAYGVPPEELGSRPSSAAVAEALPGAALVKGFNHLPAKVLEEDPNVSAMRRVVFLSSDDDAAARKIADLAEELGYAPVQLGKLAEGGLLVQARGNTWAPLIFQDLFKKGE